MLAEEKPTIEKLKKQVFLSRNLAGQFKGEYAKTTRCNDDTASGCPLNALHTAFSHTAFVRGSIAELRVQSGGKRVLTDVERARSARQLSEYSARSPFYGLLNCIP